MKNWPKITNQRPSCSRLNISVCVCGPVHYNLKSAIGQGYKG